MQHFNNINFERQGNTDNDLRLESNEEVCQAIHDISVTALRSIKIFSPDLEYHLYNDEQFRQNILKFARGNRYAQIQILVADITTAVHHGHQLLRLAQQLTTAMQIRLTPEDYIETGLSFMLVDQSDFIFKPASSNPFAIHSNCKNRINKLLEFFTPAWEQAVLAPQSQQFHI